MECSVVIPTWRRPAELERCLRALDAQAHAAGEAVVVIREDDEQSRAVLERRAHASLTLRPVTVRVPGVVAALEAGRRAARGEVLAITDDDAVPDVQWLRRIVDHFQANPQLGAVGGRDRFDGRDATTQVNDVGKIRWYGRRLGEHHRGFGAPRPADLLKGVNMAFRSVAIADIGFDQRLRGSGSQRHWEIGVCLGAKWAGWQVLYDPELVVDHYEAARFGVDQRGFGDLGELRSAVHNETYLMLRWLPVWRKAFVLAYGLLVGLREAPGVVTALERALRTGNRRMVLKRLVAATRGRLDGVATYVKVLRED